MAQKKKVRDVLLNPLVLAQALAIAHVVLGYFMK